jgi:hypothetical protein
MQADPQELTYETHSRYICAAHLAAVNAPLFLTPTQRRVALTDSRGDHLADDSSRRARGPCAAASR